MGTPVPPKVDSKFGSSVAAIALAIGCAYGSAASAQISQTANDAMAAIVPLTAPAATSPTTTSLLGMPGAVGTMTGPVNIHIPNKAETPVVIFVDHKAIEAGTSAMTVGGALIDAQVRVGPHDIVTPKQTAALPPDGIVHVQRVTTWTQNICSRIAPSVVSRMSNSLLKNTTRVLNVGSSGLRQTTIRFISIDGQRAQSRVVAVRTLISARPRIIARGIANSREEIAERISALAENTLSRTDMITHAAMAMIATAYTAFCDTCSGTGRGATGMIVHHGVVAVDPRVIPLGSRLFIPGYGHAVAGDTGGAIIGHRIDLAFNSYDDAIRFGRRPVTVYVLP